MWCLKDGSRYVSCFVSHYFILNLLLFILLTGFKVKASYKIQRPKTVRIYSYGNIKINHLKPCLTQQLFFNLKLSCIPAKHSICLLCVVFSLKIQYLSKLQVSILICDSKH